MLFRLVLLRMLMVYEMLSLCGAISSKGGVLCRRITNRESARRMRKKRAEERQMTAQEVQAPQMWGLLHADQLLLAVSLQSYPHTHGGASSERRTDEYGSKLEGEIVMSSHLSPQLTTGVVQLSGQVCAVLQQACLSQNST